MKDTLGGVIVAVSFFAFVGGIHMMLKHAFQTNKKLDNFFFDDFHHSTYIAREATFAVPCTFVPNWETTGLVAIRDNNYRIFMSSTEYNNYLLHVTPEVATLIKWRSFHKKDIHSL